MYKRKHEQEASSSKRPKGEGQFTGSEIGQIKLLVSTAVHKREPDISETIEEFGMDFDQMPQQEFVFHLSEGVSFNFGDARPGSFVFGSSQDDDVVPQTPSTSQQDVVYESGSESDDFPEKQPSLVLGEFMRQDDGVVPSSLPEELIPPVKSVILPPGEGVSMDIPLETTSVPSDEEIVSEEDDRLPTEEQQEERAWEVRELRAAQLEDFDVDLDEDYVSEVAGEMAGEAFREFFDGVVSEIISEMDEGAPDPEILRWLLRSDAEMTELLDTVRAETVNNLKEAIPGLAQEPGMAKK